MTQEAKILLGIGIVTVGILLGGVFFLSGSNPPTPKGSKVDTKILIQSDSQKIGNPKAKIQLVEFSDFQCPYCGASYPFTKEIVSKYKTNLLFVYRHYPLTQHKNAMIAAEAAQAAGAQGKFWEMHDMLFENQSSWSESTSPLDIFKTYAEKLHLDMNKFVDEIKNEKYLAKIQKDREDGNKAGITGTPTYLLNGEQINGYNSPSELKDLLDKKIQEQLQ
jgi:protein-disulfide isomerase